MSSKIYSAAIYGLESYLIEVEADLIGDSPKFNIVGLPDLAVQEARERVRSAIKNSGLKFPRTRITVNLAPADLKKTGPSFDLPIALSVLSLQNRLSLVPDDQKAVFAGELALDGSLRPINGTLAMAVLLKERGIERFYLPEENAKEAALIEGLKIFPVKNLEQLISHLKGEAVIKKLAVKIDLAKPRERQAEIFSKIVGQYQAKRALVVCAAGNHNMLMSGPPGSGKTMLARSLPELLPPLNFEEMLEVTRIYSVCGLLKNGGIVWERPFRSPHHTASSISLVGGGSFPKPGEITLAHRGILFLDELAEFPKSVLENLRQPMEDGLVTIARASQTLRFPSRFTLIAATNPCPCGYLTDPQKECKCTAAQVSKYQKRLSGPLLDRFDLHLEVPRLKLEEIENSQNFAPMENIVEKINRARNRQKERFAKNGLNIFTNAEIPGNSIEKFCVLDQASHKLLKEAVAKFQLSMRAYHKIIKVSRTIADLAENPEIKTEHLAEALQFRLQSI